MTSHEITSHVTIGAVPSTPKMIPNFKKSTMMSTTVLRSTIRDSLPERRAVPGTGGRLRETLR
ncbi:MAG: hypothetical protein ACRDG8_02675 [Actinomycetota bacterium]